MWPKRDVWAQVRERKSRLVVFETSAQGAPATEAPMSNHRGRLEKRNPGRKDADVSNTMKLQERARVPLE
eukprot:378109-Rhodomonas_salina.1